MKKLIYLTIIFLLIGVAGSALAHQSRLVLNETVVKVEDPEISKAYYGQLSDNPVVYQIEASQPFNLYVNFLVPATDNIRKDFIIEIRKESELIEIFNTAGYNWTNFYEPFARDNYFQGPEFKQKVGAGSYEIEIFNSDYQGKYILAIGEKEDFSLKEIIRATYLLPVIKNQFFNQSFLTVYFNQIGLYLLAFILSLLVIILFLRKIFKSRFLKRS